MLAHSHVLLSKLWLEIGVSANNSRCYIQVSKLAETLGQRTCKALLGLHAFTGFDYTASFLRKGKVRPLALIERVANFTMAFSRLGDSPDLPDDLVLSVEVFVCSLYGKPKMASVNDARNALFHQHFAPKRQEQPLHKIKGTDPSNLPPCKSVLMEKLRRANLVSGMWKNAITPNSYTWSPEVHGRSLQEDRYVMKWFEGRQVPEDVCKHIDPSEELIPEFDDELGYESDSDESDIDFD